MAVQSSEGALISPDGRTKIVHDETAAHHTPPAQTPPTDSEFRSEASIGRSATSVNDRARTNAGTPSHVTRAGAKRASVDTLWTRDVKLALASCAVGVVVGSGATWTMTRAVAPAATTREDSARTSGRTDAESPASIPQAVTPRSLAVSSIDARSSDQVPRLVATTSAPIATGGTVPLSTSKPITDVEASGSSSKAGTVRAAPRQPVSPPVKAVTFAGSSVSKSGYRGALALNSSPAGAQVFIDGREIGVTPLVVNSVPAGSRVVRITADGYHPWSGAVRIVANQRNLVTTALRRAP